MFRRSVVTGRIHKLEVAGSNLDLHRIFLNVFFFINFIAGILMQLLETVRDSTRKDRMGEIEEYAGSEVRDSESLRRPAICLANR